MCLSRQHNRPRAQVVRPTNLSLRTEQHDRTMKAAPRTPARLIALVHKWSPSIRIPLPSSRANDHSAKQTRRQLLHALALLGRRLTPHKKVRKRAEDVVLWRHERDLLGAVFCERFLRVHEPRLDDFFSAVRSWQAVYSRGKREWEAQAGGGGGGGAARGGQESDVETRVEAAVCVCVMCASCTVCF